MVKLLGLNVSDLEFSRSGNDLRVKINSTGETLNVSGQFSGTSGIEQLAFADGTIWDRSQIQAAAWFRGTAGNDMFYGSGVAEVFEAEPTIDSEQFGITIRKRNCRGCVT